MRGFSAPVAIDVAIALAVSWKPLVKSNASAVTTTTMTITVRSMRFPRLVDDGTVRSPIEYEMNTMWPFVGQAREEMSVLLHMSNSANCS